MVLNIYLSFIDWFYAKTTVICYSIGLIVMIWFMFNIIDNEENKKWY